MTTGADADKNQREEEDWWLICGRVESAMCVTFDDERKDNRDGGYAVDGVLLG